MRFAQHLDCDTFEEVEAFLYESIKGKSSLYRS